MGEIFFRQIKLQQQVILSIIPQDKDMLTNFSKTVFFVNGNYVVILFPDTIWKQYLLDQVRISYASEKARRELATVLLHS
jgi:hypothetical protein